MGSFNKKKTAVAGGVLGIALVGAGVAVFAGGADGTSPTASPTSATPDAGAKAVAATTSVSASGTVEAATTRNLAFVTAGTVTKVYVSEGGKVEAGDTIATVDATSANENLHAAYLARTEAKTALDKANSKGYDQAYATYVSAQNAYNKAYRAVEGTKIVAPFDGTITTVDTTKGTAVTAGTTVFTITDLTDLTVTADFTEADTTRLKKGQSATITFDSLGKTVKGKVVAIAPTPVSSDSTATTGGGPQMQSSTDVVQYEVELELSSLPSKARSGQAVTVEVKI